MRITNVYIVQSRQRDRLRWRLYNFQTELPLARLAVVKLRQCGKQARIISYSNPIELDNWDDDA